MNTLNTRLLKFLQKEYYRVTKLQKIQGGFYNTIFNITEWKKEITELTHELTKHGNSKL